MSDLRKAAEQAIALICSARLCEVNSMSSRQEMLRLLIEAIEALRAALAKPEQEPVGWAYVNSDGECEQIEYDDTPPDDPSITLLYAASPQRKPLTDEAYRQLMKHAHRLANDGHGELAQYLRDAIDIAHGIGGNP